ncbi:MAG: BatA and WFA domain-containing protein [Candidatus Nanohaloarchaea archaeon]|nr:BatA and WFA domain-containing protein [Candidatus Nanohaloarchaea archaeon]
MSFHAAVDSFFLTPAGLLALLALLPLLAIYLMRPEPEERVMPSMQFFMEEKRSGRMRKALRTLQRNLVLLLHILFIAVLAGALAGPYITGEEAAEHAVVVVDRSASMADDMDALHDFVERHAGRRNTLVLAGEEVAVPLENVGTQRLLDRVVTVSARDVETDIMTALEVASRYTGKVAVASDLDQTVGNGDAAAAVQDLKSSGRTVAVMDTGAGNRWGIIDVNAQQGNSTVDVKNVMDRAAQVTVTAGPTSTSLTIPAGAVETVTVPTPPGKTTVELESDPVPADNTAFISIPPDRRFRVLLISGPGNRYLEKAVELINFTAIETVTPPVNQVPRADVYVIGRTDRLLRSTVEEVESRVRSGASLVVFAQNGIFQKLSSLPVRRTGAPRNETVEIEQPRRVLVGSTTVFPLRRISGEAMATHNALVRAGHGDGEVVLYNIQDRDFRFDFLYPVFWKDLLQQLTDRPTVAAWNRETGERLNASTVEPPGGSEQAGATMVNAGFYEADRATVAANLESPDESGEEQATVDTSGLTGTDRTKKPMKPYVAALLFVMALGEFGYLRWRGVV